MADGLPGATAAPSPPAAPPGAGPRRLLVALYGTFALAATARAGVQIATKFEHSPLSYSLSLLAGLVYIAATVGLMTNRPWSRPLAWAAVSVELIGVLTVGAASFIWPHAFADDTVWTHFGQGYVFIPVVLPIIGVWWLLTSSPGRGTSAHRD